MREYEQGVHEYLARLQSEVDELRARVETESAESDLLLHLDRHRSALEGDLEGAATAAIEALFTEARS